jgi:AraC-like DNA-binding protein
MGLPFRRYLLWRRVQRAFVALKAGDDVTTAAHMAGFADAAHFARTLKAMFGVTATQIPV